MDAQQKKMENDGRLFEVESLNGAKFDEKMRNIRNGHAEWHFIKRSMLCNYESFSLYIVYAYRGIRNIGHC